MGVLSLGERWMRLSSSLLLFFFRSGPSHEHPSQQLTYLEALPQSSFGRSQSRTQSKSQGGSWSVRKSALANAVLPNDDDYVTRAFDAKQAHRQYVLGRYLPNS